MEYGADFDKALQALVGYFISRLEKFLPVPNFKQVWKCIIIHPQRCINIYNANIDFTYEIPLLIL